MIKRNFHELELIIKTEDESPDPIEIKISNFPWINGDSHDTEIKIRRLITGDNQDIDFAFTLSRSDALELATFIQHLYS